MKKRTKGIINKTKRRNNKTKRRKTRRIKKKMRGGEDFCDKLKHIFERMRGGATDEEIKGLFAKLLQEHRDDCKEFQDALNKIGNDLMSKELEDFFSQ